MKKLKKVLIIFIVVAAFIGGIFINRWQPAQNLLDDIGLGETQEPAVDKYSNYDIEIVENEDGSVTITIKPKGGM